MSAEEGAKGGMTPSEFDALVHGPTNDLPAAVVLDDESTPAPASQPSSSAEFYPLIQFDNTGGSAAIAAAGVSERSTGMRHRRGSSPVATPTPESPFRVTSRSDPREIEDKRQERLMTPFYRKHNNFMWRIVQTIAWLIFPLKWVHMTPGDTTPLYGKWIKRNLIYICMAWMFCAQVSTIAFLWNIGALINPMDQPIVLKATTTIPPDMSAIIAQSTPAEVTKNVSTVSVRATFTPTPVTYSQSNPNYTDWLQVMQKATTSYTAALPILTTRVFMHTDYESINYADLMLTLRSAQAISCRELPPDTCTCMSAPEIGIFANAIYYNGILLLNVQVENRASMQPPVEIAFEGGKQKVMLPVGVRINATTVTGVPYETVVMKEDAWCILRALLLLGVVF